MIPPQPEIIKNFMREAAEKCVLPRFRNLQQGDVMTKSCATDLVTCADQDAEFFLEERLRREYPSFGLLGEERCADNEEVLALLGQDEQPYFILDPVDGTSNFVKGDPAFGMILSCVMRGEVVQGYIYDPLKDHFMMAMKGEGVFDGDVQVFMEENKSLHKGIGKDKYFEPELKFSFNAATRALDITSSVLGCSVHEYMNLLRGHDRFYFACNVKPWDHLAGALMVREAGGVCMTWDREDYGPRDYAGSILSAASMDDWDYIYTSLLRPINLPGSRFAQGPQDLSRRLKAKPPR